MESALEGALSCLSFLRLPHPEPGHRKIIFHPGKHIEKKSRSDGRLFSPLPDTLYRLAGLSARNLSRT